METIWRLELVLLLFQIWSIVEVLILLQFQIVVKLTSRISKFKKEFLSWTMCSVDVRSESMLPLTILFQMVPFILLNLFIISIHKLELMVTQTHSSLAWTFFKTMMLISNSRFMDLVENFQMTLKPVIVLLSMVTFSIQKLTVLMVFLMLIINLSIKFNYMVELNSPAS